MAMNVCDCPRCQILRTVPFKREDPAAPTGFERWLCETPDDWPFWLLGGLVALLGLLVWSPPGVTAMLLVVGVLVAGLPFVRERLDGCQRLTSR